MTNLPFRCVLLLSVFCLGLPILSAQDRPIAPPAADLKKLDWMIGSWKHEAEGVVLKVECDKSEGGYFLERTMILQLGGHPKLTLKQFIGWNPANKRLESWGFGSDGSIETAVWVGEGKAWEAERTITYADGQKGSAVNIVTVLDKDSFIFKSVQRRHGDKILPEIMDIEVDRLK